MLYLNFAPRPDLLLPSLIEAVRPAWSDPFLPPSFGSKSCDRQMAETASGGETGMCSIQTTSLETVLWDILNPDENMVFLHKENFSRLSVLFTDELLEKENFAPLKSI